MAQSLLFKLDGHEVVRVGNLYDWCDWMDSGELTVDYTSADGVGISTVFLGLPAPRIGEGPPLLFETSLLYGGKPGRCLERYATWADAEKGHAKWTRAARERRLKTIKG